MKQSIGRGLTVVLVTGITFFYPLLAPIPHRIDEVHFKMIRKGMSLAEVESIFGAPPGEYDWAEEDPDILRSFTRGSFTFQQESLALTSFRHAIPFDTMHQQATQTNEWKSRHGSFSVHFDLNGLVRSTEHSNWVRVVPPWERVRRFLFSNQ